jgi:hypothetical protein
METKIEAIKRNMESNQDRIETNMDSAINAIQQRMEVAITTIRSEIQKTINIPVEITQVCVSVNEHGGQQNVATDRGVGNITPTLACPHSPAMLPSSACCSNRFNSSSNTTRSSTGTNEKCSEGGERRNKYRKARLQRKAELKRDIHGHLSREP